MCNCGGELHSETCHHEKKSSSLHRALTWMFFVLLLMMLAVWHFSGVNFGTATDIVVESFRGTAETTTRTPLPRTSRPDPAFVSTEKTDLDVSDKIRWLNAASTILRSMDNTTDPCHDFYKFACGNHEKMELPRQDVISVLEDQLFHHYFEAFRQGINSSSSIVRLTSKLFHACNESDSLERGRQIGDMTQSIGYGSEFKSASLEDLIRSMANDGVSSVVQIVRDPWDELDLYSGAVSVTDEFRSEILELFGPDVANSTIEFAEEFYAISIGSDTFSSTIDDMNARTPHINWTIIYGPEISGSAMVQIHQLRSDWLEQMDELIANTDASALITFCRHKYVHAKFREVPQLILTLARLEVSVQNRQLSCFHFVAFVFPDLVALTHSANYLSDVRKSSIKVLVDDIRASVLEELRKRSWLDDTSKLQGISRANSTRVLIGDTQPEHVWLMYEDRLKEAAFVDDSLDFIHLLGMPFEFHETMKLKIPGNELDVLNMNINVVNMFCDFNDHIYISPMMTRSPMFEVEGPDVYNLGLPGFTIAHEFIHDLDAERIRNHILFRNRHSTKVDCLIQQYNGYVIGEHSVDGTLTLNENIADNGAVAVAFAAFKALSKKKGQQNRLPMLENYTDDQLFFLSLAQFMCKKLNATEIATQLRDTHSPGPARLTGIVSNSEDFARAFSCPLGSPMNPEKKCQVWSFASSPYYSICLIIYLIVDLI